MVLPNHHRLSKVLLSYQRNLVKYYTQLTLIATLAEGYGNSTINTDIGVADKQVLVTLAVVLGD